MGDHQRSVCFAFAPLCPPPPPTPWLLTARMHPRVGTSQEAGRTRKDASWDAGQTHSAVALSFRGCRSSLQYLVAFLHLCFLVGLPLPWLTHPTSCRVALQALSPFGALETRAVFLGPGRAKIPRTSSTRTGISARRHACYVLKLFLFPHKVRYRTACLPSSTSFCFLLFFSPPVSPLSLFLLESKHFFQLLPLGMTFPERGGSCCASSGARICCSH